jgi:UDP-N-acetylglucosamine--N-acetylmuramyl-(pentapeptide) pyrophosphoryl-undecaprenol N-acetylglucosamine transferase
MKILLVGGGSGGHITPLLAVAHKLKKKHSRATIDYVIEKGSKFSDMPSKSQDISTIHRIYAGKFRRYHGESFWQQVTDVQTMFLNIRDFFKMLGGCFEAFFLLRRLRPQIVFIKGGFVGVPIGLSCALLGIPYMTHDSDALPGLANRIIARWAHMHLVGMPEEFYSYPIEKMAFVGVPVGAEYSQVTKANKQEFRDQLDIPRDAKVICITGGSLGAQRLNTLLHPILEQLVTDDSSVFVLHQTGSDEPIYYDGLQHIAEHKFVHNLWVHTGAADVVITRAGATTIAELAAQQKAVILVPNPNLAGGHQLKNAEQLAAADAVEVLREEDLKDKKKSQKVISDLLSNTERKTKLAANLHKTVHRDSAELIVKLISEQVEA